MAVEKRITVIVVLDVQRAAHARRHLDDEAERAAIVAAADVGVEGGVNKIQTKGLANGPPAFARQNPAVPLPPERDDVVGGMVLHVDHVLDRMAVDFEQQVALADAELRRQAAALNGRDPSPGGLGRLWRGSHGARNSIVSVVARRRSP